MSIYFVSLSLYCLYSCYSCSSVAVPQNNLLRYFNGKKWLVKKSCANITENTSTTHPENWMNMIKYLAIALNDAQSQNKLITKNSSELFNSRAEKLITGKTVSEQMISNKLLFDMPYATNNQLKTTELVLSTNLRNVTTLDVISQPNEEPENIPKSQKVPVEEKLINQNARKATLTNMVDHLVSQELPINDKEIKNNTFLCKPEEDMIQRQILPKGSYKSSLNLNQKPHVRRRVILNQRPINADKKVVRLNSQINDQKQIRKRYNVVNPQNSLNNIKQLRYNKVEAKYNNQNSFINKQRSKDIQPKVSRKDPLLLKSFSNMHTSINKIIAAHTSRFPKINNNLSTKKYFQTSQFFNQIPETKVNRKYIQSRNIKHMKQTLGNKQRIRLNNTQANSIKRKPLIGRQRSDKNGYKVNNSRKPLIIHVNSQNGDQESLKDIMAILEDGVEIDVGSEYDDDQSINYAEFDSDGLRVGLPDYANAHYNADFESKKAENTEALYNSIQTNTENYLEIQKNVDDSKMFVIPDETGNTRNIEVTQQVEKLNYINPNQDILVNKGKKGNLKLYHDEILAQNSEDVENNNGIMVAYADLDNTNNYAIKATDNAAAYPYEDEAVVKTNYQIYDGDPNQYDDISMDGTYGEEYGENEYATGYRFKNIGTNPPQNSQIFLARANQGEQLTRTSPKSLQVKSKQIVNVSGNNIQQKNN